MAFQLTNKTTKKDVLDYLKEKFNITKGLSKKTKDELINLIQENERGKEETKEETKKEENDDYTKWTKKKLINYIETYFFMKGMRMTNLKKSTDERLREIIVKYKIVENYELVQKKYDEKEKQKDIEIQKQNANYKIRNWLKKMIKKRRYEKIEKSENKIWIFRYVKHLTKKYILEDKEKELLMKMEQYKKIRQEGANVEWREIGDDLSLQVNYINWMNSFLGGRYKYKVNDWYSEIKEYI